MPASSAGLPPGDRVLDVRPRDLAQRAPSSCRGCGTATPAPRRRARRSPPCRRARRRARSRPVSRRGEVAHHRDDVAQQRAEGADRGVDRLAAARRTRSRSPRGWPARPRACPRRTCSGTRRARPASRPARARSCRRPGSSRASCPRVISTYLRPSAERGRTISVESLRQRAGVLVERQAEHGDHACRRRLRLRLDLGDRADARAADLDVVADDELGGARHLGLDLVGRHERQALVRVVGQEDGDEHRRARSRRRSAPGCPRSLRRATSCRRPCRTGSRAARPTGRASASAVAAAAGAPRPAARRRAARRGACGAAVAARARASRGRAPSAPGVGRRRRRLAARRARSRRSASSRFGPWLLARPAFALDLLDLLAERARQRDRRRAQHRVLADGVDRARRGVQRRRRGAAPGGKFAEQPATGSTA